MKELRMQTHKWWNLIGATTKALTSIAHYILVQVSSESLYKRNWSGYSFVHNRLQNWMNVKRVETLVNVYTNARLLHEETPIVLLGIKNFHSKESLSKVDNNNKNTSMEGASFDILDEDNDGRANELAEGEDEDDVF